MSLYKMYQSVKDHENAQEIMTTCIKMFDEIMDDYKERCPEKYKEFKNKLYVLMYGYHFNAELLDEAYEYMLNDNGTNAPKWSVDETESLLKQNSVQMSNYNKYDWNYVMNMLYSDYCQLLGETTNSYVNLAIKFLDDQDAPNGKALRYYLAMKD